MMNSTLTTTVRTVLGAFAATAAIVALAGCSSHIKTAPTVHNATIDGMQAEETTNVDKGQTLTVHLPTLGGAKYVWRVTPDSVNNNKCVSFVDRIEQQFPTGGLAGTGEPAWDVFIFHANHTGEVSLRFVYEHQFSNDQIPAREFALDVNVVVPGQDNTVASAE